MLNKTFYKSKVSFEGIKGTIVEVTEGKGSDIYVVLCPPHPLFGGSRHDIRLVHIANKLAYRGISSLRMDYKRYSGGKREVEDVLMAISYVSKKRKAASIGIFGYSFGAVVASNAVFKAEKVHKGMLKAFAAMSILRKVKGIEANLNSEAPKLMIHGTYDQFAPYEDFLRLYEEVKGSKEKLILDTDHFYFGKMDIVSEKVCNFFKTFL